LRLAFFGLPLAALLLLADGHDVAFCVLSRREAAGRRRLTQRLGARVHLRGELSEEEIVEEMSRTRPDLLVSWFFTTKLPMSIVRAAKGGGIGVHPSLLPRHRGPDPYFAAIDQGDRITGVTVHRLEAEYDTGAILATRELAIDPTWNAWTLARRLDRPSLALLRDIVRRLAAGEPVPAVEQDEGLASSAPEPSDADCALVWSWPVDRVLRRVRALAPSPGAFTEIGGQIVTILDARPALDFPRALLAGEAAVVDERALVRAGDGAIELLRGEIDGVLLDARDLVGVIARSRDLVVG
jgi:methionyl-tRNA formyltransferase